MSTWYLKDYLILGALILNFFFLYKINKFNKKLVWTTLEGFRSDLGIIYKKLEIINLNNEKSNLEINFLESYLRNDFEQEELEKLDKILGKNEENEYKKIMRNCNKKIGMYEGRIKDLESDIKKCGLEKSVRLDGIVYRDFAEKYG